MTFRDSLYPFRQKTVISLICKIFGEKDYCRKAVKAKFWHNCSEWFFSSVLSFILRRAFCTVSSISFWFGACCGKAKSAE